MKSPQEDTQAGDSDTGSTRYGSPTFTYPSHRSPGNSVVSLLSLQDVGIDIENGNRVPRGDLRVHRARKLLDERLAERASTVALCSDSRRASVSGPRDLAGLFPELEFFEVRFEPSGNDAKCQQVELDLPIFKFHPTDGVKLEVSRIAEGSVLRGDTVLKLPFERGATALQLAEPGSSFMFSTIARGIPKRATWARRLALPSHRFIYLVVRDEFLKV